MPLSNTANAASLLTTPLFFNRDDPYAICKECMELMSYGFSVSIRNLVFPNLGLGLKFGLSKWYKVRYSIWVRFNAVVGRGGMHVIYNKITLEKVMMAAATHC